MESNQSDNINLPHESKGNVDLPFFKAEPIFNTVEKRPQIPQKGTPETKRWRIIESIRINPEKTAYYHSKQLKINYSQVHQILKELVFCRVVCVKAGLDSNGEQVETFVLPEVQNG